MADLRKRLQEAAGQGPSGSGNLKTRALTEGQQARVAELLDKVTHGFSRAGYHLLIKNEAWLRDGGISAQDYIDTKEGKRFRGALLIRLSRGNVRAEVSLSESEPAKFRITWRTNQPQEQVDRIDRSILTRLREAVDQTVQEQMEYALRILL